MVFPWHDWQFWVVTAACLLGLLGIVSPFLPRRGKPADACGGCATGTAACARKQALERVGVARSRRSGQAGPLVVLDQRR
jgi:hypothetical protein